MTALTPQDLATLQAGAPVPFELQLAAGCWLCERVLRVLPGRRVVLQARKTSNESTAGTDSDEPEGQYFLLKLFLGPGSRRCGHVCGCGGAAARDHRHVRRLNELLDEFMEQYQLEDQDWRKQKPWYNPGQ